MSARCSTVNGAEVLVKTNPRDPVAPATPDPAPNAFRQGHHLRAQRMATQRRPERAHREHADDARRESRARRITTSSAGRTSTGCCTGCRARRRASPVVAYGDWIASPVPDRAQVRILAAIFLAMFAMFMIAYVLVRRYSLRHPEIARALLPLDADRKAAARLARRGGRCPVSAGRADSETARGDPRWEIVGFHRPLSGFFYNYLLVADRS